MKRFKARRQGRALHGRALSRWTVCFLPALSLLALSPHVHADINQWSGIGPDGGYVFDAEFSPTTPGELFAVGLSGFYRSTNDGASWRFTQQNLGHTNYDIDVSPTDPARLLVAAYSYALLSTTHGETFTTPQQTPDGITLRAKFARDGVTAYFSASSKVYRSVDRGQTWTERTPLPAGEISVIAIDPSDPAIVYVSTAAEGLFVSEDGGNAWRPLPILPPPELYQPAIFQLSVDPGRPARLLAATNQGLFISDDRGLTWPGHTITAGLADVDVDPSNSDVIYVTTLDGQIQKSVDGGGQWTTLATLHTGLTAPRLSISPLQPSRLMAITADGISMSSDGGLTWQVRNKGLTTGYVASVTPGTGRIYVGANSGRLFSLPSGSSSLVEADSNLLELQQARSASMGVISIPGPTDDTLFAVLGAKSVVRSRDSGRTWTATSLSNAVEPRLLAASALEPRTVYAGTSDGVYKTTDEGDTWSRQSTGLPSSPLEVQALVVGGTPAVLYAATFIPTQNEANPYQLFRSNDSAASWAPVKVASNERLMALAVDPQNDQVLFAGRGSNLYRSLDGGVTWSVGKNVDGNALCCTFGAIVFDPGNSKVISAVSSSLIVRSVDGGESWQSLGGGVAGATPLSPPFLSTLALDPSQSSTLVVGSVGWGVRQMTIAPDLELAITRVASLSANVAGTYTLRLRNLGPFDATNVRVSAQLPASSTGTSATASGATCSTVQTTVTCTYDIVRAQASPMEVSLTTAPTANGPFAVMASIAGDQPDAAAANNSVSASVNVGAPIPTDPPPPPSSSGGGGGGALSFEILLMLSGLQLARWRRPRATNIAT